MGLFRSFATTLLVAATVTLAPSVPAQALPAVWSYPGAAPCDTTLQACVDASSAGDTIWIGADVALPGSLSIWESLTIEGDPALATPPTVGRNRTPLTWNIHSEDPTDATQVNVAIRNLELRQIRLSAYYPKGSGSTFEVSHVDMVGKYGSNNETSIGLTAYAPMTVLVTDNTIASDGNGVSITTVTGGTAGFGVETPGTFEALIERNVVTTTDPTQSQGNQLSLRPFAGSSSHVRFYDNLIVGVGGCSCGSASGLAISSVSQSGAGGVSRVDVWHNTIVRSGRGGAGSASGLNIGRGSQAPLTVNLFDNVVAASTGPGIQIYSAIKSPMISTGANDWYGNAEKNVWSGVAHPNELYVAPGFIDPVEDFRLTSGSQLLDRGVVCRPGGLGLQDVTGRSRLAGASVDLGAYERGAVPGVVGVVEIAGSGENTLIGTDGQDFLCGGPGNDELFGAGGNDYLEGGKDVDVAHGEVGDDVIMARDGLAGDTADGGKGADICVVDVGDAKVSC